MHRMSPNKRAAGKGGIPSLLTNERARPALPEHERLALRRMLCEKCKQREATVHLTEIARSKDLPDERVLERHFCEPCGNDYMRGSPTLSAMRSLICLSEGYRSRLYDLLE